MDILWLIAMALFVAYLAVPFARQMGYAYGRYNRFADIMIVLLGTLIFSALVVALFSALGAWAGGAIGALVLGFIGALLMVVLLTIFSISETTHEDRLQETPDREL